MIPSHEGHPHQAFRPSTNAAANKQTKIVRALTMHGHWLDDALFDQALYPIPSKMTPFKISAHNPFPKTNQQPPNNPSEILPETNDTAVTLKLTL